MDDLGVLDVPRQKRKAVGRPKVPEPMIPIASFKGSKAFAAWFDRLLEHCRMPTSVVIEHALMEFAKTMKFQEKPPRR